MKIKKKYLKKFNFLNSKLNSLKIKNYSKKNLIQNFLNIFIYKIIKFFVKNIKKQQDKVLKKKIRKNFKINKNKFLLKSSLKENLLKFKYQKLVNKIKIRKKKRKTFTQK